MRHYHLQSEEYRPLLVGSWFSIVSAFFCQSRVEKQVYGALLNKTTVNVENVRQSGPCLNLYNSSALPKAIPIAIKKWLAFSIFLNMKACFSLAHKHKHKDIRTRRMAYLTQISLPAPLNPMINKMADEESAILLMICSHEIWVKVTYDWSTALCLCIFLCLPRFH